MYSVSQAFKNAIFAHDRPRDIVYGTVTFPDETTMEITPSIMPTNAITISRQCIDNDELMFGGVFLSSLDLSLFTDKSRYAFYGAEIELFYKIKVGEEVVENVTEDVYESVPLGVYIVSDADRPSEGRVELTAYDCMRFLDKELGDAVLQGTPYDILLAASLATGYPLAFTREDIASWVNADAILQVDSTRGANTYRDAVKIACQPMGCFAQDDRTGQLELRRFSLTPDITLDKSHWYSVLPADYMCNYVALSVTGMAGTFTATVEDPGEIGNTMIIEDAPAWDYGLEEVLQGYTDNLFDYLTTIDYTPCDISMPSNPIFDCGDRIRLDTGADKPESQRYIETLVTSFDWKYHNGMSIESDGVNPYLTGASTKDISRIISQEISDNKVQFYHITNEREIEIGDEETKQIGRINFAAVAKTSAMFIATILVDVEVDDIEHTTEEELEVPVKVYNILGEEIQLLDGDGNPVTLTGDTTSTHTYYRDGHVTATIFYALNDDIIAYRAVEKLIAGRHIISVEYPLTGLETQIPYHWEVFITCNGGTITLDERSLRATLFGQGLIEDTVWDGTIEADDEISTVNVTSLTVADFDDTSIDITMLTPEAVTVTETITPPDVTALSVAGLVESGVSITLQNSVYGLMSEDGQCAILNADSTLIITTED